MSGKSAWRDKNRSKCCLSGKVCLHIYRKRGKTSRKNYWAVQRQGTKKKSHKFSLHRLKNFRTNEKQVVWHRQQHQEWNFFINKFQKADEVGVMKPNVEPKFTILLMFWRFLQSFIQLIKTCWYAEAEDYDEVVHKIPTKHQTREGPLKNWKNTPVIGKKSSKCGRSRRMKFWRAGTFDTLHITSWLFDS